MNEQMNKQTKEKMGMIYVFTGDGKGKTSSAMGVATRALLLNKSVAWVAFYKQASWGIAEAKLTEKFPNLSMYFGGKGFRISEKVNESKIKKVKIAKIAGDAVVVDTASEGEHLQAAQTCLQRATELLAEKPFLLVLDEVLNAIADGLIEERRVLELLDKRGETHFVLTGRGATKLIVAAADLVTDCRKIKHPYDAGKLAVAGLDF